MIDLRDKFDNSWGDDHWKLDEHVQKIAIRNASGQKSKTILKCYA